MSSSARSTRACRSYHGHTAVFELHRPTAGQDHSDSLLKTGLHRNSVRSILGCVSRPGRHMRLDLDQRINWVGGTVDTQGIGGLKRDHSRCRLVVQASRRAQPGFFSYGDQIGRLISKDLLHD